MVRWETWRLWSMCRWSNEWSHKSNITTGTENGASSPPPDSPNPTCPVIGVQSKLSKVWMIEENARMTHKDWLNTVLN